MQNLTPQDVCTFLQRLDAPLDLARCTAVSKHWAAGVHQIRPTTLRLYRSLPDTGTSDSALNEMRWLESWHKQGRLQRVKDLDLNEAAEPYPTEGQKHLTEASYFSKTIITYTGLWKLRRCSLAGPFCVRSTVRLLPTSVQSLSLCSKYGLGPNCTEGDMVLSDFQGFHPSSF